jgi:integrase
MADGSPRSMRVGGRSTTAAFADWWMTTYAPRLRFGSVDKYRQRLGRLGSLADVPIGDVSPARVADWQTSLLTMPRSSGRPLAPTTVADTRSTIRQMFSSAVDLEVIRTNPVDRVKPPKVNCSPGRVLTRDEVVRLIAEVDHHRYAAVVAIMFTVGLRVSEVLGLAWCDIDLDAGTAHVRRAVVAGEGGRQVRAHQDRGATGMHPPRRGNRRAVARLENAAGRGTFARRTALANPHLRGTAARSGLHEGRRRARRPPADRQTAASCCRQGRDRRHSARHPRWSPDRGHRAVHGRDRHR